MSDTCVRAIDKVQKGEKLAKSITGNPEHGSVLSSARHIRYLARVVAVVRRADVVDAQDAGERRNLSDLDGVLVKVMGVRCRQLVLLQLLLLLEAEQSARVLVPGDVERMVTHAARAHHLHALALLVVCAKVERRNFWRHFVIDVEGGKTR